VSLDVGFFSLPKTDTDDSDITHQMKHKLTAYNMPSFMTPSVFVE